MMSNIDIKFSNELRREIILECIIVKIIHTLQNKKVLSIDTTIIYYLQLKLRLL